MESKRRRQRVENLTQERVENRRKRERVENALLTPDSSDEPNCKIDANVEGDHCEDPSDPPSIYEPILQIKVVDDERQDKNSLELNFKTEPDDGAGQDQIPWCTPSVDEPFCKIETDNNDGLSENPLITSPVYETNYINETETYCSEKPLVEEPICKIETEDNDSLNEQRLNTSAVYEINYINETDKNTLDPPSLEEPICKIETVNNTTVKQSFHEDCITKTDSKPKRRARFTDNIRKQQLKEALVKYRSGEKYRAAVAKNQAKNPEVHRAAARKYQAKNPEAHRAAVARYQAKKREARRAAAPNKDQVNNFEKHQAAASFEVNQAALDIIARMEIKFRNGANL